MPFSLWLTSYSLMVKLQRPPVSDIFGAKSLIQLVSIRQPEARRPMTTCAVDRLFGACKIPSFLTSIIQMIKLVKLAPVNAHSELDNFLRPESYVRTLCFQDVRHC